ncbi:MAG: ankyrin repeat domain-containing protein [Bryobacterales bacterium]|nr:ankyrin repeat domain-containing protein [Bryobacterales bacterium]
MNQYPLRWMAMALAVTMWSAPTTQPGQNKNAALLQAIRAGDGARIKVLLSEGADANAADEAGTPAAMNAVLYANAEVLRMLLEAGASANAKNAMGSTALVWAAGDPVKAKLLMDAGADVNAASPTGRTPLHVAATSSGNTPTVRLLLEKGAKVDARDGLEPMPPLFTGGGKATPLVEAGRVGDLETVRALVKGGANVNAAGANNVTALTEATLFGRREIVRFLLDNGASVKGPGAAMQKMPLLSMAAIRGDVAIARMLVEAGAEVNIADAHGATPLMWAAASDRVNAAMVAYLLQAGADVRGRNNGGESALDWAMRRGETAVVKLLRKAGAPQQEAVAVAPAKYATTEIPVEKTLATLVESGTKAKSQGCGTCHNHMLPMVALAAARRAGIAVDGEQEKKLTNIVLGMVKPATGILMEGSDVFPDLPVTGSFLLEALAAQGKPMDETIAAVVHTVASKQAPDGRWIGWAPRGPLENGDIQATMLAIRSMRLYPIAGRKVEFEGRMLKAGRWLRTAQAMTTEEYVARLLGLYWAGMPAAEVREAARQLRTKQRADGGWGQLPSLGSDAYATARAVYAMREAMGDHADAYSVRKGIQYLRKTQLEDGTWHVATRSFPFQPLVDTGFPHGRDQWISAAATSWAAIVLMPSAVSTVPERVADLKTGDGRRETGDGR